MAARECGERRRRDEAVGVCYERGWSIVVVGTGIGGGVRGQIRWERV